MAEVTWSIQALEDITEIGLFFERDSPQYAEVLVNRLYHSVDRLIQFPESGRVVPELADPKIREVIVEGYRLIYELRENTEILAVLHSRRDLGKKLSKR